jgi:hypothetical protein
MWKPHVSSIAAFIVACVVSATAGAQQPGSAPLTLTPQDYAEIQQLYARSAHGLDYAIDDGNLYAAVFTPDGVFVDADGTIYQGREQLAEFARAWGLPHSQRAPMNTRHSLYNVRIDPAPEGATGPANFASGKAYVVVSRAVAAGNPVIVIDAGQYHDSLVRTSDGWRIKRRVLVRQRPQPAL